MEQIQLISLLSVQWTKRAMKIYLSATDKFVFSRSSLKETASGGADAADCESVLPR